MLFDAMPRSEEGENFQPFRGLGWDSLGWLLLFFFFPLATFENKRGGVAFCCFLFCFCLFFPPCCYEKEKRKERESVCE